MREAVIIEAVRTPIGRRNGALSGIRPDDLAAMVLKEVVRRAGIPPELVEDVLMGCVTQTGEQARDIGRLAALIAGFPVDVPGVTIDRQCGSSQQAVHFAAQAILSGDMDVVVAAGVESMSRVPMSSNFQGAAFSKQLTSRYEMIHQGLSAERIADKWGFSREQLDEFSLLSHEKAVQARKEGRHSLPRPHSFPGSLLPLLPLKMFTSTIANKPKYVNTTVACLLPLLSPPSAQLA